MYRKITKKRLKSFFFGDFFPRSIIYSFGGKVVLVGKCENSFRTPLFVCLNEQSLNMRKSVESESFFLLNPVITARALRVRV